MHSCVPNIFLEDFQVVRVQSCTGGGRYGHSIGLTVCPVSAQEGVSHSAPLCAVDNDGDRHHRLGHTGGKHGAIMAALCRDHEALQHRWSSHHTPVYRSNALLAAA